MEVRINKAVKPFTPIVVTIVLESAAEHASLCTKLNLSVNEVVKGYTTRLQYVLGVSPDDVREAERECGYKLYSNVCDAYQA